MMMRTEVAEMIGNEHSLTQIKLTSGETISAGLCLVGVGKCSILFLSVMHLVLSRVAKLSVNEIPLLL